MTTLYSAWVGSPVAGRILCTYTRSYTSDHTQAIFSGTLYFEANYNMTDSVNSWAVSGDDGSHSGSNLAISFGSGGGTKAFYSNWSFQKYGDGSIAGSVSGLEAVGQTVSGSFTLDAGALAPYITGSYSAVSITSSGFTTSGLAGNGNGGTLNNTQVEYNTSQSDSGALYKTVGSYANTSITGLRRSTAYWFRMRVSNSTYGWGPWGAWVQVTTNTTVPQAPDTTWSFTNITQTSFEVTGNHVQDDGGHLLTGWDLQYNTTQSETGATLLSTTDATVAPATGLTPGTLFYARIRAKNADGNGVWSAWKQVTTLPGVYLLVGGVWVNAVPYVNVGGVWKPAVRYVNVGGVWKQ